MRQRDSYQRIMAQCAKDWHEFRRDRLSLGLAFLLPLVTLLLIGYGLRLELKSIPLEVHDKDDSPVSRKIVESLYATNILVPCRNRQPLLKNTEAARALKSESEDISANQTRDERLHQEAEALKSDRAKILVRLPEGLQRNLDRWKPASIDFLIDGSDINSALVITGIAKRAQTHLSELTRSERVSSTEGRARAVPVVRIWFNPGRQEALYVVPGAIAVILWIYPSLLAAVAGSREREQGTILRAFNSGLTAMEFLIGKAAVIFGIGIIEAVSVAVLSFLLFGIGFRGDWTPLLASTPIYLATAIMFGLTAGFRARSQTVAVQTISTAGFFPTLLLSGFVYPPHNIPFPLSLCPYFVPAKYYVDICRDGFVRGAGWLSVETAALALVTFAAVFTWSAWTGLNRMRLRSKSR